MENISLSQASLHLGDRDGLFINYKEHSQEQNILLLEIHALRGQLNSLKEYLHVEFGDVEKNLRGVHYKLEQMNNNLFEYKDKHLALADSVNELSQKVEALATVQMHVMQQQQELINSVIQYYNRPLWVRFWNWLTGK